MIIQIEISSRRIADMFVGAVEHNDMTAAWCRGFFFKNEETEPPAGKGGTPWYDDPTTYDDPKLSIQVLEDDGAQVIKHQVDQKTLAAGLILMAQDYPDHFADFMKENDDGITHDVFLQCVALGEVKYG